MEASSIRLKADKKNLPKVMIFTGRNLDRARCFGKVRMQIELAVEEIFVNIASYAYAPGEGDVDLCMEISGEPAAAVITFTDQGIPFDPLQEEDPDVTLPAAQRRIGGLGILTIKKFMDDVQYERRGDSNVLTIRKTLEG